MSLLNTIKSGLRSLASKFSAFVPPPPAPLPTAHDLPPIPPYDVSRYIHVSVPLTPTPDDQRRLAAGLGIDLAPYRCGGLIVNGKLIGHTLRNGRNMVKHEADKLAADLGFNNKQRRKLRRKMLARLSELQGVGATA